MCYILLELCSTNFISLSPNLIIATKIVFQSNVFLKRGFMVIQDMQVPVIACAGSLEFTISAFRVGARSSGGSKTKMTGGPHSSYTSYIFNYQVRWPCSTRIWLRVSSHVEFSVFTLYSSRNRRKRGEEEVKRDWERGAVRQGKRGGVGQAGQGAGHARQAEQAGQT